MAFDGVIKVDLETQQSVTHLWPEGWYGGEVSFAPRNPQAAPGTDTEDDGYLLSFIADESGEHAEMWVLDAAHLEAGPVCTLTVPARVPTGYHTRWVDRSQVG